MDRPALAIFSNSCPPYRLHVHQRIAREIPEVRLFSPFTHEQSDAAWAFKTSQEIGAVSFGQGETVSSTHPLHEWLKGGRMTRWIRQNNIRAVVMSGYNDPGRLRVIRYCRRHGIPCMLHADSNILGDTAVGLRAWAKRRLVPRVIKACAAVLVCGTLGRDYFLRYGARPEQIFFYPYEPDYQMIRNVPTESLEQVRQRFGLAPGRRRIVYSGRLVPVKRVDMAIDAFSAIAAQRPEWDMVIVGDGILRHELESRVPENVRGRIRWTGFLDNQPAVSAIYRLSDVLVLPSEYEPWALVVNEAAAAGMAIVASHVVGAAAELVRDGINGRIFRAGDLSELRRALLEVSEPARIDATRAASAGVLRDWQQRADPINGLREALRKTGVL